MTDMHAPSPEFTRFLEWQTVTTLRRSERFHAISADRAGTESDIGTESESDTDTESGVTPNAGMGARPSLARIVRIAAIVLFSMSAGAVGVVAAERVRDSKVVERLLAAQSIRITLDEQRLAGAGAALERARALFESARVPISSLMPLREDQLLVEERLALLRVDSEEIRITGREPVRSLDAPVVAARDFEGERLNLSLAARQQLHDLATERFEVAKRLFENAIQPASYVADEKYRVDLAALDVELFEAMGKLRKAFVDGDHEGLAVVRLGHLLEVDMRRRELEVERAHVTVRLEEAEMRYRAGLAPNATEAIRADLARIDAELGLNALERSLYEGE